MATWMRRGLATIATAAVAVMTATCLWLSASATATEPGLLKVTSADAYSMASIIRGVRTHGSDVKVERQPTTVGGQILQVWVRARPGSLAKVGVYTLTLMTDRHGKVMFARVGEFKAPSRHYSFGDNGLEETYTFTLSQWPSHQWQVATTYVVHEHYHSFEWSTGRLAGRPPEPHLTLADLEVLWKQASLVITKAIGRTSVSEEDVLHPGLVCHATTPYTEECKAEG